MITVAEHTYEETLLPEKANILDLGCRGFLFACDLNLLGYNVICVDAENMPYPAGLHYRNVAICGYNGWGTLNRTNDPQATSVMKGGNEVQCYTIESFIESVGIKFDLIKMDIEGSEYEVIMSLTEAPARQISVEFHLHTKIYGDAQVKEMEDKLVSLGYYPAKHDKYPAHGLPANYWDSLFILQS